MIEKIIKNAFKLSTKQFSNYVVQMILERGNAQHKKMLQDEVILPKFYELAVDKFGSNVAEKSVVYADSVFITQLWNSLKPNTEK